MPRGTKPQRIKLTRGAPLVMITRAFWSGAISLRGTNAGVSAETKHVRNRTGHPLDGLGFRWIARPDFWSAASIVIQRNTARKNRTGEKPTFGSCTPVLPDIFVMLNVVNGVQ